MGTLVGLLCVGIRDCIRVGADEGRIVGADVGDLKGSWDTVTGFKVGMSVGLTDGVADVTLTRDGASVGPYDGLTVGSLEGSTVGPYDGLTDCITVGGADGSADGI